MSLFSTRAIELQRPLQGQYVGGVWKPSAPRRIAARGTIQATKPSDLNLLPEGRRLERSYTLYSKTQIIEGDEVTIDGELYEVLQVARWQNGLINHYKAIAVKHQKEGSL